MFEKVVTDKTVEDENSVIVRRKYWEAVVSAFFFSLVLLSP